MNLNKKVLKELINEVLNDLDKKSMLLETPVEEATAGSVSDRVNVPTPSDQPEGFAIGETGRIVDKFMIISADRGEKSAAENKKRYQKMKQRVSTAGFPFTELEGGWTETEKGTGVMKDVIESSIIVYDEPRGPGAPPPTIPLKELGQQLSQPDEEGGYDQQSFIYGQLASTTSGEVHRIVKAYGPDGRQQDWLQATSLEKVPEDAAYWSRIRRKGPKTQLKEEEDVVEIEAPNSVIEAMRKASQYKGKKIKFIRRKD